MMLPDMHVTILLANGERQVFDVTGSRTTIGRRPDCDLHIDSPAVSRLHAELLRLENGLWELRDLGSLNGLEVRGRAVGTWQLTEGDEVIIGDARMVFGDAPLGDSTVILRRRAGARLWLDGDHRCLRRGDKQLGDRLAPR